MKKHDFVLVVIVALFLLSFYALLASLIGCKTTEVTYDCRSIPDNLTAEQAADYVDQCTWWNNMTDPCSLKFGPSACDWKRL